MFKLMIEIYKIHKAKLWALYASYILFVLVMSLPLLGEKWYRFAFSYTIIVSVLSANLFDKKNLGENQGKSIFLPISFSKVYFAWLNSKFVVFTAVVLTLYILSAYIVPLYNPEAETSNLDLSFLLKAGLILTITQGIYPDMRKRFASKGKFISHIVSSMCILIFVIASQFAWFFFPTFILPEYSQYWMPYKWVDIPFVIVFAVSIYIGKQIFVNKKAFLV